MATGQRACKCKLVVRAQALEAKKSAKLRRTYFDWDDWLKAHPNTPYTPIIPLLHGLEQSLALLRAEGFDNVIARHHRWECRVHPIQSSCIAFTECARNCPSLPAYVP